MDTRLLPALSAKSYYYARVVWAIKLKTELNKVPYNHAWTLMSKVLALCAQRARIMALKAALREFETLCDVQLSQEDVRYSLRREHRYVYTSTEDEKELVLRETLARLSECKRDWEIERRNGRVVSFSPFCYLVKDEFVWIDTNFLIAAGLLQVNSKK